MLSYPEAPLIFGSPRRVVIDEIHALAEIKRGDQLMLGLAQLRRFAPYLTVTGLSATVENPAQLADYMGGARVILADTSPPPDIAMLPTQPPPPWAGGGWQHAAGDVMDATRDARLTRAQPRKFRRHHGPSGSIILV